MWTISDATGAAYTRARPIVVTPTYDRGYLARILEIEQRQVEDTVTDLSEEQMMWRPNPWAKSAGEITRGIKALTPEPVLRPACGYGPRVCRRYCGCGL
jgi:hypothetical protein